MGDTRIPWATKVWNPITGCGDERISPGCENCYARKLAETRLRGRFGYPEDEPFRVTLHDDKWGLPIDWKKPQRIFVNSMGDLFHDDIDRAWLNRILWTIEQCPRHVFMILTKRVQRMWEYMSEYYFLRMMKPLSNLWLGATVCNQDEADRILPQLLKIEAALRFVSFEPLLGPIVISPEVTWFLGARRIGWMIAGPETGPNRRPFEWEWSASLMHLCERAEIPFFAKGPLWPGYKREFPPEVPL